MKNKVTLPTTKDGYYWYEGLPYRIEGEEGVKPCGLPITKEEIQIIKDAKKRITRKT